MTHEASFDLPIAIQVDHALIESAQQVPAPPAPLPVTDSEQVRALEAAFAARDKESEQVAGLLGLWAGTALLHDLAIEAFSKPAGEIESYEKKSKNEDKRS
jgi:hypothetical protein